MSTIEAPEPGMLADVIEGHINAIAAHTLPAAREKLTRALR